MRRLRAVARLAAALAAALLLWAAPALPPAPGAAGQALDLRTLFGGEPAQEPAPMSRPEDGRPADLAAYGALEDYAPPRSMVSGATERVDLFRQRLARMLEEADGGLARMRDRLQARSPDGTAGYFAGVALVAAILILIGRAVVQLFAVYVFRPLMISAQRASPPVGISGRLPVLALRLALTVLAIVIAASTALGLGLWMVEANPPAQATAGIVLAAWALFVLVDTAWRMVLSPYLSEYRIPRLSDGAARRLYLWVSAVAAATIVGRAWIIWIEEMGVDAEFIRLNAIALGFLGLLLTLGLIWANRRGITEAILQRRPIAEATRIAAVGARVWAPLATLAFLGAWLAEAFRQVMGADQTLPLQAGAFLALMAALMVQALGLWLTERLLERRAGAPRADAPDAPAPAAAPGPAEAAASPAPAASAPEAPGPTLRAIPFSASSGADGAHERAPSVGGSPVRPRVMRTYPDLGRRVSSLLALATGAYLLVRIWGGPGIFSEDTVWGRFEDVIDILFIGYIGWHAVRIWLDQRIEAEGADDMAPVPGDEGGGASAVSRLGTLLPLFRSAILIVIGISVALVVAAEMGLNVAPLFAGAGIVGIAIGFGAQTLVRDILSGVFFLLDDAFRKGEYLDVGEVKGTVEKISLRSFQLRHHLGALHTIPFGEIPRLTNYSRDWVMMKLPLRLTYDTDVEKVRKLVKKLGQKLLEHPVEGPKFLQPLKSQGVYRMEDSAMIIRVKYMTRPGDQWTTRKLVYQEIRELFEREGIRFAHREVTVRMPDLPGDRPPTEDEKRAAAAAARHAVDEADAQASGAGGAAAAAEAR